MSTVCQELPFQNSASERQLWLFGHADARATHLVADKQEPGHITWLARFSALPLPGIDPRTRRKQSFYGTAQLAPPAASRR